MEPEPKTETVGVIPDPIVDGVSVVTYDPETDTVTMPRWYWLKLVRFIIDKL